jgi:signal transduction histidine kinase
MTLLRWLTLKLKALKHLQKELKQGVSTSELAEIEGVKSVIDIALDLCKNSEYRNVHQSILDLSIAALRTPAGLKDALVAALLIITSEGDNGTKLRVSASRQLSEEDTQLVLSSQGSFIAYVIKEGDPRLLKDSYQDVLLEKISSFSRCRSFYCVPVNCDSRTCGVFLFAHPEVEFFTPEHRQILEFIGNRAMTAIADVRSSQKMAKDRRRLVEIRQRSRKKLAREIHDGPTQSIAALAMRINIARRLMENPSDALIEELDKIEDLARRTTREMRHLLFALHPVVLETQDLQSALTDLADKVLETFNQEVVLSLEPDIIKNLNSPKQALIFDISVEAVNNACKHAQPKNIWVRLKRAEDNVALLEIEDDGVGFDPTKVNEVNYNRTGLGLLNLCECVELIQGEIKIESWKGEGTLIQARIPLNPQANAGLMYDA